MSHIETRALRDTHRSEQDRTLAFMMPTTIQWIVSSSVKMQMLILLISDLQGT